MFGLADCLSYFRSIFVKREFQNKSRKRRLFTLTTSEVFLQTRIIALQRKMLAFMCACALKMLFMTWEGFTKRGERPQIEIPPRKGSFYSTFQFYCKRKLFQTHTFRELQQFYVKIEFQNKYWFLANCQRIAKNAKNNG